MSLRILAGLGLYEITWLGVTVAIRYPRLAFGFYEF